MRGDAHLKGRGSIQGAVKTLKLRTPGFPAKAFAMVGEVALSPLKGGDKDCVRDGSSTHTRVISHFRCVFNNKKGCLVFFRCDPC